MPTRSSKSKVGRLKIYDDRARYGKLVAKHFFPIDRWLKLDKLDRELVAKIAHWFEYYVEYILDLPENRKNIESQFSLIALFSAVEASIGFKKGDAEDLFYEFFKNNLDESSLVQLTKSVKPGVKRTPSLKFTVTELVRRRNDLLHRAELINLNNGSSIGYIGRGRAKRGRKRGIVLMSLTPETLYEITKAGLLNYFSLKPTDRRPIQDINSL